MRKKKKIHKPWMTKERKERFSLTGVFSLVIFGILIIAIVIAALLLMLLTALGVFGSDGYELGLADGIIFISSISVFMGTCLSMLIGKFPLKPINTLINHMNRLAAGDYKTRLQFKGPIANNPAFNEISDSFNTLAEELENTEMLRGDFINNFSHEFKTPIVSIAGLAKLVNKGNLTEEQKKQYLTAIEEESLRLSAMATNVLNLTKVENQSILTDVRIYNLSEQIRGAILLLDSKWEKKNIQFQLDEKEHRIEANEELMKLVWINLIDNAIKFSPEGGMVEIAIEQQEGLLAVGITNYGASISPEEQRKIFNKFYQADESHSGEGNGIGLAIVKRVLDLHGGEVSVTSQENKTTFWVKMSK